MIKSSTYYYIVGIREEKTGDIEIKLPKINKFNSIAEASTRFPLEYKDFIKHYGINKFRIVKETKILEICGVFDKKGNKVKSEVIVNVN